MDHVLVGSVEQSARAVKRPHQVHRLSREVGGDVFPRGRPDIALAVVRRAGRELNADWVVDDALPLADRLTANFARMAVHARAPSDAWRIHRRARAADQPDFDEVIDDYLRAITSSIALNHLGTPDPPPLVALALAGYLTFGVTVLDQARVTDAPQAPVTQILSDTLLATIQAARTASDASR